MDAFGNTVTLSFTLPVGDTGAPGEVSNATLSNENGTTARNPNGVAQLAGNISNPPTQAELQTLQDKINELIAALQR